MNKSKINTNQAYQEKLKTLDGENLEPALKAVYEQILELLMLDFKDLSN